MSEERTYAVEGCYRDRQEPYLHEVADPQYVEYFRTHAPFEWIKQEPARQAYQRIYGDEALKVLDQTGLVAENNAGEWVGGTNWQTRPLRPIYGGPAAKPVPDHTGMVQVPTPFGPTWVPAGSAPLTTMSAAQVLDNIRLIVREELERARL